MTSSGSSSKPPTYFSVTTPVSAYAARNPSPRKSQTHTPSTKRRPSGESLRRGGLAGLSAGWNDIDGNLDRRDTSDYKRRPVSRAVSKPRAAQLPRPAAARAARPRRRRSTAPASTTRWSWTRYRSPALAVPPVRASCAGVSTLLVPRRVSVAFCEQDFALMHLVGCPVTRRQREGVGELGREGLRQVAGRNGSAGQFKNAGQRRRKFAALQQDAAMLQERTRSLRCALPTTFDVPLTRSPAVWCSKHSTSPNFFSRPQTTASEVAPKSARHSCTQ